MIDQRNADEPRMTPERTAQIRAALLAEVTRRPAPRRWRVRGTVAGVALALAVGGTAAAWVTVLRPDESNSGYCAPQATLDREVWMVNGFGVADTPEGERGSVDGREVCAAMWRAGMVTDPDGDPVPVIGLPPDETHLAACVVDGFLVVYPGDEDICEQLGVPRAESVE